MLHRSLSLLSFPLCPTTEPFLSLNYLNLDYRIPFCGQNFFYPHFPPSSLTVAVRMKTLVLKVLCSTLLLLAVVPIVCSQSDCSQAESCDLCVGDSMLNLTGCVWRLCPTGNDTGMCVTDQGDSADIAMNCSWTRVSELCTVVETVADGGGGGDSGDGSSPNPSPEFSQAKFDMSSFIGGIILVLCVQAGGFAAMRFLKSKEQSSYDPM
ncbi:CD164 sialomucin-like 2 protein isoform X1 [Notolabrus celidotus]|uniref:CD164 sialomucin-like 2 protein isoform X1 n=1 Tax=Notolabrus celidotus TaxID=1203425 RepID=UPI00148FFC82|nr:CD164 sialomucin-like 2 protein isoform X1 [Notolabrus celidotus]